jgi:prepilin-type N-terminal cleavage/methylation domain-containing protein
MLKARENRRGFTLVELMVVIGIIAMLASIAVPSYHNVRRKAREAEIAKNLSTINLALQQFATDNNGKYPYRVTVYDALGNNFIANTDSTTFYPMGLWGGVQTVNSDGSLRVDYIEQTFVQPQWTVNEFRFFNQLTDPLVGIGYLASYPENPFLKRPMGGILWAFSGQDVTIPHPQVIVSPGDFVYTFNMGDALDPSDEYSNREAPPGVVPEAMSYEVSGISAVPDLRFKVDLVDSYQLWAYGSLQLNGVLYAVYANNDNATPKRPLKAKKDWNGNGIGDMFETGIIVYFSGGERFFQKETSTGEKIEF